MTDSGIKYVGVDGCTGGWVAVGLGDGVETCVKVFGRGEFPNLLEHFSGASVVLVDMPIGLPEGVPTYRCCDNEAMEVLKGSESSVFRVPSIEFVTEFENEKSLGKPWVYDDAKNWIKGVCKDAKLISQQGFHIVEKIIEVDKELKSRDESASPKVREVHPEVCFWALNKALVGKKKPMRHSKSRGLGFLERFRLVRSFVPNSEDLLNEVSDKYPKSKVSDDDVLDALAAAITAKIGCQRGGFKTLPENPPTDSKGLPMEMVYAIP